MKHVCKECGRELPKPVFKPGDKVQFRDYKHSDNPNGFVVVDASVREAHQRMWNVIGPDDVALIGLDDGKAYSTNAAGLVKL